ncbi:hypothetical protein HZA56_05290 [Candidatus Poribacteria bacterium]|nr:hypothetical protein [Candidatus Poribacteria bacterium]
MLQKPRIRRGSQDESLILEVYPERAIEKNTAQRLPGMDRHYAPVSDYLHDVLRNPFRDILPDDTLYERYFDKFEYLRALIHADQLEKLGHGVWGPVGRFAWKQPMTETHIVNEIDREVRESGADWPPLSAGLFDKSLDRLNVIRDKYDESWRRLGWC